VSNAVTARAQFASVPLLNGAAQLCQLLAMVTFGSSEGIVAYSLLVAADLIVKVFAAYSFQELAITIRERDFVSEGIISGCVAGLIGAGAGVYLGGWRIGVEALVLAGSGLAAGLTVPPQIRLTRAKDFQRLQRFLVLPLVAGSLAAVVGFWGGLDGASAILFIAAGSLVRVSLVYDIAKRQDSCGIDWSIYNKGALLFFDKIVQAITQNLDRFIVGSCFGAALAAPYVLASQSVSFPVRLISPMLERVVLAQAYSLGGCAMMWRRICYGAGVLLALMAVCIGLFAFFIVSWGGAGAAGYAYALSICLLWGVALKRVASLIMGPLELRVAGTRKYVILNFAELLLLFMAGWMARDPSGFAMWYGAGGVVLTVVAGVWYYNYIEGRGINEI